MKYKIHEMLAVYRITISFRGGCIYRHHERLPEDDVLKSKHVGANHM